MQMQQAQQQVATVAPEQAVAAVQQIMAQLDPNHVAQQQQQQQEAFAAVVQQGAAGYPTAVSAAAPGEASASMPMQQG